MLSLGLSTGLLPATDAQPEVAQMLKPEVAQQLTALAPFAQIRIFETSEGHTDEGEYVPTK